MNTDFDYEAAIAEIEQLLDAEVMQGSEGYERLEALSVLVEEYEDQAFPMGEVTGGG